MRALDRKLLRDLGRMKAQAAAIALVLAAGMALFVGMAETSRALRLSERRYYDDYRFAQVWSHLARAPESVVRRLAAVPGVAAVEGRLVTEGVLDLPGVDEPATGLFISIPPRSRHVLNDLYIRRGRHPDPGNANEALVSEVFADTARLHVGDTVRAVIGGQRVTLRIVGVALSPEFIMQIPPGGVWPDDRRFGVFWVTRDRLAELLDLRGVVNDVSLRLSHGASEASVIAAVDRVLEPYGGEGAYGRASQPSYVMVEDHIGPIATLAAVVPGVFLAVAVFLVNVVLSRLVATERSQIGMMKAFGYSDARLARHYLLLVLAIAAGGVVLGLPVGVWLGREMAAWFTTFFRFPVPVFRVDPSIIAIGAGVILLVPALGAIGTLRRVVRLPPIVAMAAPAPLYRPTLVDRAGAIARIRAPVGRMILRSVTRHPVRALLTGAAMSGAITIVVFGGSIADAMNRIIDLQFHVAERQDLSVVLTHPRSLEQWAGFERLPGVRRAEPYRAVPARLLVNGRTQDISVLGLEASGSLRRITGANYRTVRVPPDGMIMNTWLGAKLGLRRGDRVVMEIREERRRVVTAHVVDLIDEPLGTTAYMELKALDRLLGEPNTFSAVNLLVDPLKARDLYAVLKRAPQALGVDFRKVELANFRPMIDQTITFVQKIQLLFAVIIAFGVVYNTARIAVAERAYDLATLRVLGFTRREISNMLLGEIGTLVAPAIPLGCALGYGLSAFLVTLLPSDLLRVPLVVLPRTYALAVVVFLVAAAGSALVVRRRLDRLDLIGVLKARE